MSATTMTCWPPRACTTTSPPPDRCPATAARRPSRSRSTSPRIHSSSPATCWRRSFPWTPPTTSSNRTGPMTRHCRAVVQAGYPTCRSKTSPCAGRPLSGQQITIAGTTPTRGADPPTAVGTTRSRSSIRRPGRPSSSPAVLPIQQHRRRQQCRTVLRLHAPQRRGGRRQPASHGHRQFLRQHFREQLLGHGGDQQHRQHVGNVDGGPGRRPLGRQSCRATNAAGEVTVSWQDANLGNAAAASAFLDSIALTDETTGTQIGATTLAYTRAKRQYCSGRIVRPRGLSPSNSPRAISSTDVLQATVQADSNGGVYDSNPANNTSTAAVSAVPSALLAVTGLG